MLKPYWHRSTNKERSKRSEKLLAKAVGGRVQLASGALPIARFKGDVITPRFLLEDKTTRQRSFRITPELWNKIAKQAFCAGHREPVIHIRFEDADLEVYVVSKTLFETTSWDESKT